MIKIIQKTLRVLTRREKSRIPPLLLMMLVSAALEALGVTLVIPVVSRILSPAGDAGGGLQTRIGLLPPFPGAGQEISAMLVLLIAVFVVKNLFLQLQTYLQYRYTAGIRLRVQARLLHYYMTRPYVFFLTAESGDILRTVSTDSDYYFALCNHLLRFFTEVIVCAILMTVIFLIHPKITLALGLVLLADYLLVLYVIKPFLRRYGKRYRAALGRANSLIIEFFSGIKSIKVSGREAHFEERYGKELRTLVRSTMIERAFQGSPRHLIEASTVTVLLSYLLVMLHRQEDLSGILPVLSAFVVAAARVLPSVGRISSAISYAGYYEPSLDKVLSICTQLGGESEPVREAGTASAFREEIRMRDIRFRYPDGDKPVLDGAELVIPCNRSVGITGSSGGGKTTLVDLLLGLLRFQEGHILLDGEPADPNSPAWRRLFAYIPQKIFMLNASIRENVGFGLQPDEIDEDKVWQALEAAQMAEFVRSLPAGLETAVGEAGIRLSGGQVQRLGIARALYADPQILVFDEATSALDYETEDALMESIDHLRGKKTLVIIAHRLSTVENCDLLYRVQDGKVLRER